jgi:TPR repeat protein
MLALHLLLLTSTACRCSGVLSNDAQEAIYWFTKAADLGYPLAMCNLANTLDSHPSTAKAPDTDVRVRQLYQRAAELGLARAQNLIGYYYDHGKGGEQDEVQAKQWFQRAAEQNHAIAINNLGLMWLHGKGGQLDAVKARECFERAADLGDMRGMYNLASCVYNGNGCTRSLTEAFRLFRQSADEGYALAQQFVGVMFDHGLGTAIDHVEAFNYFHKAINGGELKTQSMALELLDRRPELINHTSIPAMTLIQFFRQLTVRKTYAKWQVNMLLKGMKIHTRIHTHSLSLSLTICFSDHCVLSLELSWETSIHCWYPEAIQLAIKTILTLALLRPPSTTTTTSSSCSTSTTCSSSSSSSSPSKPCGVWLVPTFPESVLGYIPPELVRLICESTANQWQLSLDLGPRPSSDDSDDNNGDSDNNNNDNNRNGEDDAEDSREGEH